MMGKRPSATVLLGIFIGAMALLFALVVLS